MHVVVFRYLVINNTDYCVNAMTTVSMELYRNYISIRSILGRFAQYYKNIYNAYSSLFYKKRKIILHGKWWLFGIW